MQRLGETLFMVGVGLLGFASTGGPWFGWAILGGVVCLAAGSRLGQFKHRWWPHPPMRDAEHEVSIGVKEQGDRASRL